jgi:hypothetical protein
MRSSLHSSPFLAFSTLASRIFRAFDRAVFQQQHMGAAVRAAPLTRKRTRRHRLNELLRGTHAEHSLHWAPAILDSTRMMHRPCLCPSTQPHATASSSSSSSSNSNNNNIVHLTGYARGSSRLFPIDGKGSCTRARVIAAIICRGACDTALHGRSSAGSTVCLRRGVSLLHVLHQGQHRDPQIRQ